MVNDQGEFNKKQRMKVSTSREIYTFSWLKLVSWHLYKEAESTEKGRYLNCMASQVFSAFSVEGCLNHVGKEVFTSWNDIERKLGPREKLALLSEKLALKPDFTVRPYLTFREMFQLRDMLAHGKTERLIPGEKIFFTDFDEIPKMPKANWEEQVSLHKAKIFLDDSTAVCKDLLKKLPENQEDLLYIPDIADWVKIPVEEE